MIIIVAPYSPAGRSQTPHLGAARKIETVVDILSQFGMPIVLVNTAHEQEVAAPTAVCGARIAGITVTEVTPPTYLKRRRGKLRNIFDVAQVAEVVVALGKPRLVWLYNGYAMESRLGVELRRRCGCKIIQEMEDWHFSRSRGLNPKPLFDWWLWREAAKQAAHVFAVNEALADRVRPLNASVSLFPGAVAPGIAGIRAARPPFSQADGSVTIGYFGGLSAEKGADSVLALSALLPNHYRLIVTGSGPLQDDFAANSAGNAGKLEFHGRVDDSRLIELIARCDVLLNPHSPIDRMANGIFPFKVIEAIASGRMLVSTSLPDEGLKNVLQGVRFCDHGTAELQEALLGARDWFTAHRLKVEAGADAALRTFGRDAMLKMVENVMAERGS